jgi:hypothetical protein
MAHQLRLGQTDGSVRAEIDPELEAGQFILTGLGLIFRWTLSQEQYDLGEQFRQWRERLQRTLGPSPGAELSAVDAPRA